MSDSEHLLERYLDGALDAAELAAFQASLAADPELQAEVELQEEIDAAIARQAQAPDAAALLARARAEHAGAPAGRIIRPLWQRTLLLVAAAAALLLVLYPLLFPEPLDPGQPVAYQSGREGPPRPFHTIYAQRVAAGFKPDWVCADDAEFAGTFEKEVGQAVVLAAVPEGVEALGLAYVHSLSRNTTCLLARVEGAPVLVFVDRGQVDRPGLSLPAGSPLQLHRRELGDLVLYELTPHAEARVLELFRRPSG